MLSVYQHWDPLRVCIVGRSYSPEFYSFIECPSAREVMQRVAQETEDDYQKLVQLLESFNVTVLRPTVTDNYNDYITTNHETTRILPPPMSPRDFGIMIGKTFFWNHHTVAGFEHIFEFIRNQGNEIVFKPLNGAEVTRLGKDLYHGTQDKQWFTADVKQEMEHRYQQQWRATIPMLTEYRNHIVDTGGHVDGTFCPVKPGLIVSLEEVKNYQSTFPNWEIVYLQDESWKKVGAFLQLKEKNRGKWWIPGEELNDNFITFVNDWLDNWVGYVEESVFDVNMLVIDHQNVVCNGYNQHVFEAFDRHGITPHIVNFRHRYFWDGGLHCITNDLDRIGVMNDYFPERANWPMTTIHT